MYQTVFDGILFVEGALTAARPIKAVQITLKGIGSQLQTLDDVKRRMAAEARRAGGNCILNFTYGQKSSWWAVDHVKWHGAGVIAAVEESVVRQLTTSSNA